MSFCPNCGSPHPDAARFCARCGSPLGATTPPAPTAAVPGEVPTAPSAPEAVIPTAMPEIPAVPYPPIAPEAPVINSVPEVPVVDSVPEAPVVDSVPEVPVVNSVPEAPAVGSMPEAPVVDSMPEAPAAQYTEQQVPQQPVIPQGIPNGYAANNGYNVPEGYAAYPPQEPPKKKRKLWLWILLPVLVLLIAGALLFYFLIWNAPKNRIVRAADQSKEAFKTLFANTENLQNAIDAVSDYEKAGQYSADLEMTLDAASYIDFDANIKMSMNYDRPSRCLDGTVNSGIEKYTLGFLFSADEASFMLQAPELSDGTYGLPLKDFGQSLSDVLGDDDDDSANILRRLELDFFVEPVSTDDFLETYKTDYDRFIDTLKFAKDGKMDQVTLYSVAYDAEALATLLQDCLQYGLDHIMFRGIELEDITADVELDPEKVAEYFRDVILGIDQNGNLSYFSFTDEYGARNTYRLTGTENPWTSVEFRTDDEIVCVVNTEQTGVGFTCTAYDGADSITLTCDDTRGELRFSTDVSDDLLSSEEVVLSYGYHNEIADFTLTYDSIVVHWSYAPLSKNPAMLAADMINVLTMTEEDTQALLDEVRVKTAGNPSYDWLQAYFIGSDIQGAWYFEGDVTDQYTEIITEQLGLDLQMEEPFILAFTLTLDEDEHFTVSIDHDRTDASFEALRKAIEAPLVEAVYQIGEESGWSREEFAEAFLETYGVTVEEYAAQNVAMLEFTSSDVYGDYWIEGDVIFLDGDSCGEYSFELESNTLRLVSLNPYGDDLFGSFIGEGPLELERK